MAPTTPSTAGLDPLKELFETILVRLEALESKVGGGTPHNKGSGGSLPGPSSHDKIPPKGSKRMSVVHVSADQASEAVVAFDDYIKSSVMPLALTCDELGGLQDIGKHLMDAWDGIRGIVVLATQAKSPGDDLTTALTPHLAQTQDSIKAIHGIKVDRDWDRHYKAVIEMLPCLSWVLCKAPKVLPANCAKDAIGAAEFWTNKIRKDVKDDEAQIDFCNMVKKTLTDLVGHIEKYHKTGLTWNPKGVSLAEAAVVLAEPPAEPTKDVMKSPMGKRRGVGSLVGGNLTGLVSELGSKLNADGSSAATGLRKVTRDQQTWRKEFDKDKAASATAPNAPKPPMPKKTEKKKLTGLPIFEFQDRGHKWVVENHTTESAKRESETGVLTVEVTDPKQQVYIYNCSGITVKVNGGKFKNLILDKCEKCNAVFHSVISSTEVVNSKRIQFQIDGICPVFTIDKTIGCLIWLSKESADISSFVVSMSSELNISFPDGDDMKELPIPEQFVHKLTNGVVKSGVSDLYH